VRTVVCETACRGTRAGRRRELADWFYRLPVSACAFIRSGQSKAARPSQMQGVQRMACVLWHAALRPQTLGGGSALPAKHMQCTQDRSNNANRTAISSYHSRARTRHAPMLGLVRKATVMRWAPPSASRTTQCCECRLYTALMAALRLARISSKPL
jgi:hypothetical protein